MGLETVEGFLSEQDFVLLMDTIEIVICLWYVFEWHEWGVCGSQDSIATVLGSAFQNIQCNIDDDISHAFVTFLLLKW